MRILLIRRRWAAVFVLFISSNIPAVNLGLNSNVIPSTQALFAGNPAGSAACLKNCPDEGLGGKVELTGHVASHNSDNITGNRTISFTTTAGVFNSMFGLAAGLDRGEYALDDALKRFQSRYAVAANFKFWEKHIVGVSYSQTEEVLPFTKQGFDALVLLGSSATTRSLQLGYTQLKDENRFLGYYIKFADKRTIETDGKVEEFGRAPSFGFAGLGRYLGLEAEMVMPNFNSDEPLKRRGHFLTKILLQYPLGERMRLLGSSGIRINTKQQLGDEFDKHSQLHSLGIEYEHGNFTFDSALTLITWPGASFWDATQQLQLHISGGYRF